MNFKLNSRSSIFIIFLAAILFSACNSTDTPYPSLKKQRAAANKKSYVIPVRILDSSQIVNDLRFLSSDTCEGRGPGSTGHNMAVKRIMTRMREAGLDSFKSSLLKVFKARSVNQSKFGINIFGCVKGTAFPDKFIAITAHYDHEGIKDGKTYYGASDNASGTACLLGLAKYFKQNPHSYSLIFIAFDREETGLEGSRYFSDHLPVDSGKIKFNLNIDMIARNDKNEIFACGLYHNPAYISLINETQQKTNAKLLMGHDYEEGQDNWTSRSDHFPFHEKDIPFIYIGVEDHPDLHKPTDTFDKIDLSVYMENCNMVAMMIKLLDRRLLKSHENDR